MNVQKINKLQRECGYGELQDMINNGAAWTMEGSYGRAAMNALESGACMLPLVGRRDAYGNTVPPRTVLKKGTKGTYQNSKRFWEKVEISGEIHFDN